MQNSSLTHDDPYRRFTRMSSISKYTPHCGERQRARYLRQIRKGWHRTSAHAHAVTREREHYVTTEARLTAHGFVSPQEG